MTRRGVSHHLATEEGVYGVILVAGMIVASGTHATAVWEVFTAVVVTVVVFWAAHVYAATVAHHGARNGHTLTLGAALRHALNRSLGLLVSALIPTSILLLGVAHIVDDATAVWAALWAGVVVLAVIGFLTYRSRGSSAWICILGAASTAGFGIVMILLKAALH